MTATGPAFAVIFDIDGVLLHLTRSEERLFFDAFRKVHSVLEHHLNPDWNSYQVRNDVNIAHELLERHFGRVPVQAEIDDVFEHYISSIEAGLAQGSLQAQSIDGAGALLERLRGRGNVKLGLATANLEAAAAARLKNADLWGYYDVGGYAEVTGPKIEILRHAIAQLSECPGDPVSPQRIVYFGDQLGDLAAARENAVHFIGMSPSAQQRDLLRANGAEVVADGHHESGALIQQAIGQPS